MTWLKINWLKARSISRSGEGNICRLQHMIVEALIEAWTQELKI